MTNRGKDSDVIEDILDALRTFDSDEDGRITVEEFIYAMTNMGDKMTADEVRDLLDEEHLRSGFLVIDDFAQTIMNRI